MCDLFFFFFFKQKTAYEIGLGIPAEPLFRSAEAVKILIFAAEGLTKRSAVGFLLRSLIMFQTFISRHNSNFFSDKDRKSGSAGMPRPISYAVFCLKKKKKKINIFSYMHQCKL